LIVGAIMHKSTVSNNAGKSKNNNDSLEKNGAVVVLAVVVLAMVDVVLSWL
jgi:hypothetical protein